MKNVYKSNKKAYNKLMFRMRIEKSHAKDLAETGYCARLFFGDMPCCGNCLRCFECAIKRHNFLCQV